MAVVLNYSNSLVNPILYALRIPEFRKALALCCFRRKAATDGGGNERRDDRKATSTAVTRLRTLRTDASLVQLTGMQRGGYG